MTVDVKRIRESLLGGFSETLDDLLPWFVSQMPPAYFADTDERELLAHLRAIASARASGEPPHVTLRSEDDTRWTFIVDRDRPGMLKEIIAQIPPDVPLRQAKVHISADGRLAIDTLVLGVAPRFDPDDPEQAGRRAAILLYAAQQGEDVEAVDRFLRGCSAEYIRKATPLRAVRSSRRFAAVTGTDDTLVEVEPEADPTLSRVVVTTANAKPRRMFERCAAVLGARGVNITRAFVDVTEDPGNGFVHVYSYMVRGPDGLSVPPDSDLWRAVAPELSRMKWISDAALTLDRRAAALSLVRCEVIAALASLAHQCLVRENPYAFNRDRVLSLVSKQPEVAAEIAALLEDRFALESPLDDAAFARRAEAAHEDIERRIDGPDTRRIMHTLLLAVEKTRRTNLHRPGRYGLALRLDPTLVRRADAPEVPFGLFFVHGAGFDGFHLRFRDIARGGVRVVRTGGAEQLAAEIDRLYDEVYGLAYAQQLKNKDIPEGGAKAVIVAAPDTPVDRAVKGFIDGLLDLIVPDPRVRSLDPGTERLYLGPDENITPELIEWIVDRAARRGHPIPGTFMSSKPGAGINHKEYGVTSEGVTVFLEVALKAIGVDPRAQDFTVKITGGPDGDVAGNELKILHREYGEHAKVVGIADGSGCIEDPDGLSHDELLRLVRLSQPVSAFDPTKLGPRGKLTPVTDPDGVKARNTLHNRVKADAFVPAGGRPQTLRGDNWHEHLDAQGVPTSRVIIEGANLFLTPEARAKLGERGVLVVKDSSANKCGVICSSFEIGAAHVLSADEFIAHKTRFVAEVLVRLRSLARSEAELLFRERARHPDVLLPEHSVRLSKAMNRVRDAIERVFPTLSEDDQRLADTVVREHLPPVLVEIAGERLSKLPRAYARAIVYSSLAARMVYREGLDWVAPIPDEEVGRLAVRYLRAQREAEAVAKALREGGEVDRERLAALVSRAGARVAVEA